MVLGDNESRMHLHMICLYLLLLYRVTFKTKICDLVVTTDNCCVLLFYISSSTANKLRVYDRKKIIHILIGGNFV